MGKYNLPPDKLAQVEVVHYGGGYGYGAGYPQAGGTYTTTGLTQDQWNDLPEWQQKQYYIQYAGDPGKPTDVRLNREHTPEDGKWKHEAEKGYDVDPKKLRDLADDMEAELEEWKTTLNKVNTTKVPASAIGGSDASKSFEDMADKAQHGFSTYVAQIQQAYTGVIGKLRAAAGAYEGAHQKTQSTVNGVNPTTGNGNADL
ncbi:hypothetical protein GCM10022254_42730 [Actinomadura meridiana]|uniref:Uncharacterized protein n=1 Tax=Actinomadura meridiana TaxID=559626 RepID=A0ABP8C8F2_9ACTN